MPHSTRRQISILFQVVCLQYKGISSCRVTIEIALCWCLQSQIGNSRTVPYLGVLGHVGLHLRSRSWHNHSNLLPYAFGAYGYHFTRRVKPVQAAHTYICWDTKQISKSTHVPVADDCVSMFECDSITKRYCRYVKSLWLEVVFSHFFSNMLSFALQEGWSLKLF